MTKKDYKIIAKAISQARLNIPDLLNVPNLITQLSREFLRDNPRFDQNRFEEACKKTQ